MCSLAHRPRSRARLPRWAWLTTLAVVAAVGVPLLVACFTGGEYGSAAEWVASLATVAAFVAAVIAVRVAGRTFALERNRDADRDEEQRRSQAERVAAWIPDPVSWVGGRVTVSWMPDGSQTKAQESVSVVPSRVSVTIRNASLLPINGFQLEFWVRAPGTSDPLVFAGSYMQAIGLIPPETTTSVEIDDGNLLRELTGPALSLIVGSHDGPSDLFLGWSFIDNAGVRWRRSPRGAITEDSRREPR